MDEASRPGYSEDRRELASGGVPFVLDMDLKSQASRRTEARQQRIAHKHQFVGALNFKDLPEIWLSQIRQTGSSSS